MIFASMEIERDPPTFADLPLYFSTWFQDVGLLAALALFIWWIDFLVKKNARVEKKISVTGVLFTGATLAALGCYVIVLILLQSQGLIAEQKTDPLGTTHRFLHLTESQNLFFAIAGALAMFAVVVPMVANIVGRISFRRIWAIALLSIKESIRGRVIYVFCLMGLLFLFMGYFVSFKPEDQIRNYVGAIYTPMTLLFLITAALLGAFSIPVDVARQTIHTIVTKPVERYEIVLGRFFGHGLLLTSVLVVLSALSLIYVLRGVNPEAARESGTARVPIYADQLQFHGTKNADRGESVGREWDYRSYIGGHTPGTNAPIQYGAWRFRSLPAYLADRQEPVPFEFTFDIFRTTKGTEDLGVICTLYFVDGKLDVNQLEQKLAAFNAGFSREQTKIEDQWRQQWDSADSAEKEKIESKKQTQVDEVRSQLIEKYGIFEVGGIVVTDYHTQTVRVPPALFKTLIKAQNERAGESNAETPSTLQVLVRVNEDAASRSQMLGVAPRDLYLLAGEMPFWQNFLKGMIGLWCNTMLVLGLAIALSTYLSGIISLIVSLFLIVLGSVESFIRAIASGTSPGGGPFEAANRMFSRLPAGVPLEETTTTAAVSSIDSVFRVYLNFVLKMIPGIQRYDLTTYIAEGFDIPWTNVLLLDNFLPLLAYLIPWGVLAYYLMHYREVANPR